MNFNVSSHVTSRCNFCTKFQIAIVYYSDYVVKKNLDGFAINKQLLNVIPVLPIK